ncbi:MAG TPA: hypothetical protein VNL72_04455 [Gammaproteobacteria bacterium]|nr:hypothetical protein [Gammaproteobacteria bacterium]
MQTYATELWHSRLPEGWLLEEDEDSVSFFHPDGPGVLCITCSCKEEGLVDETDLEEFAAELLEKGLEPAHVSIGHLRGLLFEYEEGNEWWREWYLACDDLFFFITYNCDPDDRGREDATVSQILHNIEVIQ